jgi:hypothetical protein
MECRIQWVLKKGVARENQCMLRDAMGWRCKGKMCSIRHCAES